MPFQFERTDRIAEEMRREIDHIIREDLNDPRIAGTFSITHVDVTRDLRYAKVYVSIMEPENRAPMMAALKKAAGFVRRGIGKRIQIRYTPELLFERDDSIDKGAHILSLLRDPEVVKPANPANAHIDLDSEE